MSRAEDLELLRALCRYGDEVGVDGDSALSDDEHDAFGDMLVRLEDGQRELTPKQRDWAEKAAERLGLSVPRDNSRVPVGRPVETPAVLRNLPKRPPTRRAT